MATRLTLDAPTTPKADGRTLTFLANSGTRMVNGLTVDLQTLKAPLADGSLVPVKELTGTEQLTIPLLLDHIPSVDMQAGAITKLWLTDDGLMAEARLSQVAKGEEVRQLAADGVLTNSFSITIDYAHDPDKNGVIYDAELVEISVVYRGADSKAAFHTLNSRTTEEPPMNETQIAEKLAHTIAGFKLTKDEQTALTDAITEVLNTALSGIVEAINEQTEDDGEDTPAPEQPAQTTNNRAPVIINKAGRAHQTGGNVKTFDRGEKWLDSHDAFLQLERTMLDMDNQAPDKVRTAWKNTVADKLGVQRDSFGVAEADVDKFVPTEAITTITDALNTRGSGLWNLLRKTGLDRLTIGGNITGLTEETRAHGYPKSEYGNAKKEQTLKFVKRQLEADYTYKYITLNKGDIRRTQRPGALLRYVLQELPNYIIQTNERQIALGSYTDMAHFRSVVTDSTDSSSEWKGNRFALTYEMGTEGTPLKDFVRASHMVRATGNKVLICSGEMVSDLLLSANANGDTFLALGDNGLARVLGVSQIINPEWWTATDDETYGGIIMSASHYAIVGDTTIESFTNFALKTNTNEYLQEIYAGGGLDAEKSAVVIKAEAA